jgi:4-hydroxybutyryl-CoA dehydratase/vinylacetyl-CoA-Delta-isomerase
MALINGQQYRESLKKMRPNIYKYGKLIEDVTTDPATKAHIDGVAHQYDMAFDEDKKALYVGTSHLTGQPAHRWNILNQTLEDQIANADMKRDQYRWSGTCSGATCAGWTGLNCLWAVSQDVDKKYGTPYFERVKKYFQFVEDNALALAGSITDAKGNRAKAPSQQENKDSNVHVVETREDGIIVRGWKVQICGVAAANEIVCVPGSGYKDTEKDFCVAFAVPRDVEGLTIIETRRPSDERLEQEGWDAPKEGAITQAYLFFDNVFVPNDRVFLNGEKEGTGAIIGNFAAIYRSAIGSCVAGQGDIMIGAAMNMARANGLSHKVFQDKLTQMAINNEITAGLGIGAMAKGRNVNGLWVPDALLGHTNKTQVASLPYEVKVMAQDISGGIAETGCIPAYQDFVDTPYGEDMLKAMAAGTDGESRIRAARLVEWLTIGGGVPGCMHGGGSPDGARMVVKAFTKWENHAADAKRIAGITGTIEEPAKK